MREPHANPGRRSSRWYFTAGVAVLAAVALHGSHRGHARRGLPGPDPRALAEQWGIADVRLRATARGHLLDLRFRIVDADKAAALNDRVNRTALLDLSTGRRLGIPSTPKAGLLRSSGRPRPGRTYFALFGNAGGSVAPGSRVALLVGDRLVSVLRVE